LWNARNRYKKKVMPRSVLDGTGQHTGMHTLTAVGLLAPALLEGTVALGGHPVELNLLGSSEQQVRFLERPYGIPYRALVPRNLANLAIQSCGRS
jgi:hypothetical protein